MKDKRFTFITLLSTVVKALPPLLKVGIVGEGCSELKGRYRPGALG